jgi:hypothetical protein
MLDSSKTGLTQAEFVIATRLPRKARNRLREGKQSQSLRRLRRYRTLREGSRLRNDVTM